MAKSFACLVFILVILSNDEFHTQGRNLIVNKSLDHGKEARHGNVPNPKVSSSEKRMRLRLEEGYTDSYRPTTPGHSPGIGH
ncbi:hypothetical protein CDL12_03515 [Handroanthus impetiginosus]|uniref:Uncharacterized protein n=1 Tax=Handroanthus impetiginosus TaxID=429701 RepID=A0A2G9I2C3_9LAMI|nr:hypothetical protein CDL12_09089 [Handroanthus impetiginosus]PIN23760.1 hypothetical protein CDL12_03515 [Handroanthus impetiginosus]